MPESRPPLPLVELLVAALLDGRVELEGSPLASGEPGRVTINVSLNHQHASFRWAVEGKPHEYKPNDRDAA